MTERRQTPQDEWPIICEGPFPNLCTSVSPRLTTKHLEHRSLEEQGLCILLMIVGYIGEHGPLAPNEGEFLVQLPGSGWQFFQGVLMPFEGSQYGLALDFFLPEEVQ